MTTIWGRAQEIIGRSIELPIDGERIHGGPVDMSNFDVYILSHRTANLPINALDQKALANIPDEEIRDVQWALVKTQIHFSYATCPAINYLWDLFGIKPGQVSDWQAFHSRVLPVTKAHQRLLGWMNFLPAPIAETYFRGESDHEETNPNLRIRKRKWTGGTSAQQGQDYVQVPIPEADWRASVQTMSRILEPAKNILAGARCAGTTYDRRHIAEPIFEDQLESYGIHLITKPAGASDEAFYFILKENNAGVLVAPPVDHPLKGRGVPGALEHLADQLEIVLMSSATPADATLQTLARHGIASFNVGGDTGSLPTYYNLSLPREDVSEEDIEKMKRLRIIRLAPAYTEIVDSTSLTPTQNEIWGVLLQTNCAAVWQNGEWVDRDGRRYWQPDGTTSLVPALKTQMIRSSATGNLVYVVEVNAYGEATAFFHKILRYNDFEFGPDLIPVFDHPRSSGGSATGGCAA